MRRLAESLGRWLGPWLGSPRGGGHWALLTLALVGAACKPSGSGEDETGPLWTPVPVEVASVETRTLARYLRATTTLAAEEEATLLAETPGLASRVLVVQGQRVEQGAVLVELANEEGRLAADEARRQLRRWEEESARLSPLVAEGLLSRQALDEATAQREAARAQVQRAEAQARLLRVRAPFAGVITERLVHPGEVVAPQRVLFRMIGDGPLVAHLSIPERELLHIHLGQPVELLVDAYGGASVAAEIDHLDPFVDPRSGTLRARLRVLEHDVALASGDRRPLRPGMFVTARVRTEVRPGVVALPRRALTREADRAWVFVVGDQVSRPDEVTTSHPHAWRVQRRDVQTGLEEGPWVEVLEGPAQGEQVLTIGQVGLDPSALVWFPSGEANAPRPATEEHDAARPEEVVGGEGGP